MANIWGRTFIVILCAAFFTGCASAPVKEADTPKPKPLLVGITPNYPPIIFKQNKEIKGVEADLAIRLARDLGRPCQFVEVDWDELIPALMEGKFDIIMSGMTINEARKVRINFTEPYLKVGLMTLMRAEDVSKYNSLSSIKESGATVGVVKGTTAEVYVRNQFSKTATIRLLLSAGDAVYPLENRRIDLFVNDSPSVIWLASQNEGKLRAFLTPFNEDYLGWGIRRDDQDLFLQANAILGSWKADGTLKEVITRWLPYWKDSN
ncbi:MAG TPA: transporter substrate-binding domain-containing protein [Syntrophales bacterium]|nr:transporter substrate-binding domain-containing protein [Syntrophales bacterium]